MKNFDKLKSIIKDAEILKDYQKIFREETKDPSCDKKGCGFNVDDRFAAFSVKTSFDSYRGYYGNSSCSTIFNFQNIDMIQKAFCKYLDHHEKEIMDFISNDLSMEAKALKIAVEREVEQALETLRNLDKEGE